MVKPLWGKHDIPNPKRSEGEFDRMDRIERMGRERIPYHPEHPAYPVGVRCFEF